MWVVSSLRNAHPRQGKVLSFAQVTQISVVGGQATRFCPKDCCREVALRQFNLCAHCEATGNKVGNEIALMCQLCERINRRDCLAVLTTCLLQASLGNVTQCQVIGEDRQRSSHQ